VRTLQRHLDFPWLLPYNTTGVKGTLSPGIIAMQVTLVVWDDENKADILTIGFSAEEIEDVLYNDRNDTVLLPELDGSLPLCLTIGIASTGRRIAVKGRFVCGNPLEVEPVAAYLV
jgi:hypothetical protein